jgi:hypothetical protein
MSAASSSTRRRTLVVSAVTAASALFHFSRGSAEHLVFVSSTEAIVLVIAAVLGATFAVTSLRVGTFVLGIASILYGVIRLVTYGSTVGIINGGLSTGALLAGIGIAFVAIAVAGAPERPAGGMSR